jgi:CRISPR-associated protein Csd1
MSKPHPTSSLLKALVDYYDRLEADPEQEVAALGFSREKIHFEIVLEKDGSLFAVNDVRERTARGKPTFRSMLVPDTGGRSGTGMKPFFCWDNTGYVLGRDNKGKPERAEQMFDAFRGLHKTMQEAVGDDEDYAAMLAFLIDWQPAEAEALPVWEELAGQNVVFKVRGRERYVHQSEPVKRAWQTRLTQAEDAAQGDRGVSLVSGGKDELARLHPLVGGVAGANTTGAAIVSFNLDAFESYGKRQSFNAPVGVIDADKYTKALNRLLADGTRRVRIGDATVVFWADAPPEADQAATGWMVQLTQEIGGKSAEAKETAEELAASLQAVRQGRMPGGVSGDTPFYVLGLSPNASRIHVRFWLVGTLGLFAKRLADHHERLDMIGRRDGDPPLMIRNLLLETAREAKDIPRQLAGQLTRAVLEGLPYPHSLMEAVVRRIRLGDDVNRRKAALFKAYLIRNHNQEVPVALQHNHPDEAYQLGRLFAALEKTQEDVSPGLNKTIKDSYFGAASATPASVFPRLLRLHQFHIDKFDNPAFRITREKLIGEICGRMTEFPRHLPLEKQGLFHIAYYHQRQDFFTKKSDKETHNDD